MSSWRLPSSLGTNQDVSVWSGLLHGSFEISSQGQIGMPCNCLLGPNQDLFKPSLLSFLLAQLAHSVGCTPWVFLLCLSSLAGKFSNWTSSLKLEPASVRNRCFSAMVGLHCCKYWVGTAYFLHTFIFILVFYFWISKFLQFLKKKNLGFLLCFLSSFLFLFFSFFGYPWIALHHIFISGVFWDCFILSPWGKLCQSSYTVKTQVFWW